MIAAHLPPELRAVPLVRAILRLSPSARLALASLSGVLNGVGFVFFGPMVLLANLPLLIALLGAPSRRLTALAGLLTGVLGGLHIYGILDYGWLLMVGFASYTGSQMVLYALALRALWGRLNAHIDVLLPALIWTLTEHIRTLGPLAMPASYVGCIAESPPLRPWLWLAPHIGGLGVSSLVALSASLLFHGLFLGRSHRRAALLWAGALAACGLLGLTLRPPLGEAPVRLAGVQAGLLNSAYRAADVDPQIAQEIVRTYEDLTLRAYAQPVDLVIWPETAVRVPLLDDDALRTRLAPPPARPQWLIAGLLHREADRAYNLTAVVGPGGEAGARYVKVRTVPRTEAWLTPGQDFTPLRTPAGAVGPVICLESVYPQTARAQTLAGAQLLVVQSNDAGFGRSPITGHMTARAAVRAVENGRWLMRVGQAGITTLIDPRGERHGQLDLFEADVLYGTAFLRDDLTLYTRWGAWWAWLISALVALIAARSGRAHRAARRTISRASAPTPPS